MKRLLPKVEYIIIGLLAIFFLMWTASKCNAHKDQAQTESAQQANQDSLAQAAKQPAATPPPAATTPPATSSPGVYQPINPGEGTTQPAAQSGGQQSAASANEPAAASSSLSRLYVTIDKLKLRKTPGLKGEPLGELKLFDEVYYMNEATDSLYEVSLGTEKAKEPYVKVKTKRGTVGWVYGAGVSYIKKKRSGVLQ